MRLRSGRLLTLIAVLAIAGLALAACGGGSGSSGGNGGASDDGGQAGDDGAIVIEAVSGLRYNPDSVTVSVGQEVVINVVNTDSTEHDLVLDDFDVATSLLGPNESETITFTPQTAGEYEFYCSVPGHREGGMFGTLIVVD